MVTVKVNTKEFEKAMKEYMKWTSRTMVEAVNQHAYYACRNATATTKAATKEEIAKDLQTDSKKYPGVPLAALLVNMERKKKGKRGLNGEKMVRAIESFIKRMQAHRNFLRAGWIPAIKQLASLVPKKGGTAIPAGTNKKGRNFGGARAAIQSTFNRVAKASIWNSATGKGKSSGKAAAYIEQGIQRGLDKEVENMRAYIEKKHNEAVARFWGG